MASGLVGASAPIGGAVDEYRGGHIIALEDGVTNGGITDAVADSVAIAGANTRAIAVGGTVQLNAVYQNAGGDDLGGVKPTSWNSATPSKATVDANGLVTGVLAGTSVITAILASPALTSAGVTVTVS